MRERSTWNRNEIVRKASHGKRAEDPRAMNQDHLSQQPAADEYVTGGPSEFAEDVHPSAGTWEAEYSNGEVMRNEIGQAEMRRDTFNHPEKTAAMDDEAILKKADLCAKIARVMLKNASDAALEDQALALMYVPDASLVETANRLANQEEDEEEDEEGDEDQGQNKQARRSRASNDQEADEDEDQGQNKQAGQVPPQFKEQIEKTKEKAKDKADKDDDKGQNKQARAGEMFIAALKSGNGQGIEQALASMLSQAVQQQMGQQQQPMAQAQGQQMAQQNQQQLAQGQNQQQMAQNQQQMAQQNQQQQAQQQQMSDDQLLDQMLQDDMGQPQQMMGMGGYANEQDVQLEANTMDVGESQLEGADDVLNTLFASNAEYQNAVEAHAIQNGEEHPAVTASHQPMTRTAATRTVGTRPKSGVSQIGGGVAGTTSGANEVDTLSSLWRSAPDVSRTFG